MFWALTWPHIDKQCVMLSRILTFGTPMRSLPAIAVWSTNFLMWWTICGLWLTLNISAVTAPTDTQIVSVFFGLVSAVWRKNLVKKAVYVCGNVPPPSCQGKLNETKGLLCPLLPLLTGKWRAAKRAGSSRTWNDYRGCQGRFSLFSAVCLYEVFNLFFSCLT